MCLVCSCEYWALLVSIDMYGMCCKYCKTYHTTHTSQPLCCTQISRHWKTKSNSLCFACRWRQGRTGTTAVLGVWKRWNLLVVAMQVPLDFLRLLVSKRGCRSIIQLRLPLLSAQFWSSWHSSSAVRSTAWDAGDPGRQFEPCLWQAAVMWLTYQYLRNADVPRCYPLLPRSSWLAQMGKRRMQLSLLCIQFWSSCHVSGVE